MEVLDSPPPLIAGGRVTPVTPEAYKDLFFPHVYFYDKQWEIIYSVLRDSETYVPAGNMLGKDFVAGFITLYFFMTRFPCRIITTSVKEDHLRVLWGEINRYIQESRVAIRREDGGPLIVMHNEIKRWRNETKAVSPLCYVKGMVSEKGEGLSGHHVPNLGDGVPRALAICDEASGSQQVVYNMVTAWAHRILGIGNCWQCENWFKWGVKGRPGSEDRGGDLPRETGDGFWRKVIQIKAEHSPNVRFALAQIAAGIEPTGEMLVPGVLSWDEYQKRRKLWDPERQCVGLDADWYEGAEVKLFPREWLENAEKLAEQHKNRLGRVAKAIGVDSAEGGDQTALCAVDEYGVIDLVSEKTPDTSKIPKMVLNFMRTYKCLPENVIFDRGGGGYQHVCTLNQMGFKVRSVAFGEQANPANKWKYFHTMKEKQAEFEEKTIYKNRRAEMYGNLRDILNPYYETGFSIPRRFVDIFQQLSPIPLWWEDGKLTLPPKNKKPGAKDDNVITMHKLIGRSPDEADALVLAVYGMLHKPANTVLGSMV